MNTRAGFSRLGFVAAAVVIGVFVLATGGLASTPVRIGQATFQPFPLPSGSVICSFPATPTPVEGFVRIQLSTDPGEPSYAVPAGSWKVTSWTTGAYTAPDRPGTTSMGLMVFRPTTTPNRYVVVGESVVQMLDGPGLKTFALAPNTTDPPIAVQGGDVLGFWIEGTVHAADPSARSTINGCMTIEPGAVGDVQAQPVPLPSTKPSIGTQLNFLPSNNPPGSGLLLNLSATLLPPDTTAPTLSVPADFAVDATSASGSVVVYSVTATDDFDPNPTVVCAPQSGTTFPIGDTTVSCTAADASGNEATASFVIHVRGAAEQASALIELVLATNAKQGIINSLDAKLDAVRQALAAANADNRADATNKLAAFMNDVAAQSGKTLTAEEASVLISAAARISAVLG